MENLLKKAIKKSNEIQERIALLNADAADTPLQMRERTSEFFSCNDDKGNFIINY